MTRVPILRPDEVVRAFERLGWQEARRRGSHIILTKPNYPVTLSVPNHSTVARGTLRALLNRAGVTLQEFLDARK